MHPVRRGEGVAGDEMHPELAARADWVRLIALYPDSAAADAARRNLDRLDAALEGIEIDP